MVLPDIPSEIKQLSLIVRELARYCIAHHSTVIVAAHIALRVGFAGYNFSVDGDSALDVYTGSLTGIAVCAGECIVRGKVECAVHSVFADDAFQSFMSHQLRLIFAAGHAAVCRQIFLIFFTGGLKM